MKLQEIQLSYFPNTVYEYKINSSNDAYDFVIKNWNLNTINLYEEFKIILLNRTNNVLGIYHLSKGGIAGTVVDPKIVFSVALKSAASSLILIHNHPSGNLNPSEADKAITKKLVDAAKLLDIKVLDHLIITKISCYSFADSGLIY